MKEPQKSYMQIDPLARASDLITAFKLLSKEKPASKVFFQLTSGKLITNILEVNVLKNGTLIMLKISTNQGIKYEVIPTENIETVGHG